tara:strand:+ start:180 stop:320 length:141 start_codon:yes stop_codon:yes gene_type:complete
MNSNSLIYKYLRPVKGLKFLHPNPHSRQKPVLEIRYRKRGNSKYIK